LLFSPILLIRVPNISFELAKCPLVLLTLIIKSYTFLPLRWAVIGICLNSSPIFEWTLSIPVHNYIFFCKNNIIWWKIIYKMTMRETSIWFYHCKIGIKNSCHIWFHSIIITFIMIRIVGIRKTFNL